MIVFECPSCQKNLQVADQHAGKNITCPNCKAKTTVPPESQADDRPTRRKTSSTGSRPAKSAYGLGAMLLFVGGGIGAIIILGVGGFFCCSFMGAMFYSVARQKAAQDPQADVIKKADQEPERKPFKYVNDDLKIEILFPRKFQEDAIQNGKNLVCPMDQNNSFLFSYAKFKNAIDINNEAHVKLILDGGRNGALASLKGTLLADKDFTIQSKYPARDIEIQKPNGIFRTLVVLTPTHLLQIVAGGTKEFAESADAKQFRDSFKFLDEERK